MLSIDDFQTEVCAWADKQFPNRKFYYLVLGTMEELGELAHAQLKFEHGIRGEPAELAAKAKDAVGDVLCILVDICYKCKIKMRSAVWLAIEGCGFNDESEMQTFDDLFESRCREYGRFIPRTVGGDARERGRFPHRQIFQAMASLGKMAAAVSVDDKLATSDAIHLIGSIIVCLVDYCRYRGFNLQECVETMWTSVKTRDWITYPLTGRPS